MKVLRANTESKQLVKPADLSKERLETLVEQLVDIMSKPSTVGSIQLVKIIRLLEFYNLK